MNPAPHNSAASPRRSRRGWYATLGLLCLVVGFYQLENFRGERAWEACRAELTGKGEMLDWAGTIPPAVSDDSNFFSAPIVRLWLPNRTEEPKQRLPDRTNEVRQSSPGTFPEFPTGYSNSWPCTIADLKALPANPPEGKPESPSLSGLGTWFDRWAPGFDELYEASRRPEARLHGAYQDAFSRPIPDFVKVRTTAQVLATRARVHLLQGKSQLALRDLDTMQGLIRAMAARPPALVSVMIGVAMTGLYAGVVEDGLTAGLWSPDQLSALPERMESMNLLPVLVDSLRAGERAALLQLTDALMRQSFSSMSEPRTPAQILGVGRMAWFVPRGWIRQNQVRYAQLMQESIGIYDQRAGRLDARRADEVGRELDTLNPRSPYLFLSLRAFPNLTKAEAVAARNLDLLRQACVACALERHRLAHGGYPDRLVALVPEFLHALPVDVLTGEPFVYRHLPAGKFILYSKGWDLKDDGGQGKGSMDPPDWVWPGCIQ